MTLTELLWLATGCCGIHILEEYQLNWRDWARSALRLPVEWSDFYVVNTLVLASSPPISPSGPRSRSPFRP